MAESGGLNFQATAFLCVAAFSSCKITPSEKKTFAEGKSLFFGGPLLAVTKPLLRQKSFFGEQF